MYGDGTLSHYAAAIGVEPSTLSDFRRVARAFENRERSRSLSWSHHQALAAQPDRLEWLARAASGHWTVGRLRNELRTAQPAPTLTVVVGMRKPWLQRLRDALPGKYAEDLLMEFDQMSRRLLLPPPESVIDGLVTSGTVEAQMRGAMAVHLFAQEHNRWPESLEQALRRRPKPTSPARPVVLDQRKPSRKEQEDAQRRLRYEVALNPVLAAMREASGRVVPSNVAQLSFSERQALRATIGEVGNWFVRLLQAIDG
ncbi:MAG: hypothetical protein AB7I38_13425 [Dehalococcoidia bacterium]